MITEVVSGRGTWTRSQFLTRCQGNRGDVSVIVASRVWQSRRLTSPPRGPSELRLQGGLLTAPKEAGAANMTKRALEAEMLSCVGQ